MSGQLPAAEVGDRWMSQVGDETSVVDLALPGTHDTMTAGCSDVYYKTQHLSLAEQLDVGVRFLDVRLTRNMVAAHREWVSTITFDDILDDVAHFFAAHPSETILMRVQNANEQKDDYPQYVAALHECVVRRLDLFHRFATDEECPHWPTLGEARGQIIAMESSPPTLGAATVNGARWALNWHDNQRILLQDLWDGPSVADKRSAIEDLVLLPTSPGADGVLRLNHVSATNGQLGTPAAYAAELNPSTEVLLQSLANRSRSDGSAVVGDVATSSRSGRGAIIFDFIDRGLASAVVELNALG